MAGMFAFTLDCVDIATEWTEQRAVWGKGETDVLEQIEDIETSLPFPLLGFDCDNGGEFLNYHLLRRFTERKQRRLFHNFFCPSVKLIAKARIASKTIKRNAIPKTPYQRIMDSPYISVVERPAKRDCLAY